MKQIRKYEIKIACHDIRLPYDFQILKIGVQDHRIFVWILVDPDKKQDALNVRFFVVGTGHNIEDEFLSDAKYLDTIYEGTFVWHIFKENEFK